MVGLAAAGMVWPRIGWLTRRRRSTGMNAWSSRGITGLIAAAVLYPEVQSSGCKGGLTIVRQFP